jgi:PTS system N-acetylglucosamine-specific IIC component
MSGFFPVMMFGLPGACLAMYRTALPERRKAVGGLLASMALTSFLTGVTEPIEFSFMFLAPLLYVIHAVLTGIAMALMNALGVHLGFGFSAGLFDYLLNYSLSTKPWVLIPVGLGYFALYYGLFRWCIVRFELKTPGRETDIVALADTGAEVGATTPALNWIKALGNAGNLRAVEACTTRLRLVVADFSRLDEPALKALGSRGVLRMTDGAVQVVVGPIADQLASEIRAALRSSGNAGLTETPRSRTTLINTVAAPGAPLQRVIHALGGRANISGIRLNSSRLVVSLRDPRAVDEAVLHETVRAVSRPTADSVHLILGPDAPAWATALKAP